MGRMLQNSARFCRQPKKFRKASKEEEATAKSVTKGTPAEAAPELAYNKSFYRFDESCRYIEKIHQMAATGKTMGGAMGTKLSIFPANTV
jgi:hypothetical protein